VSSPSLHLPTLLLNAGKVAKNTAYVDSSASNPGTYFVFLTALYVFRSQILFEEYMQCFSSVQEPTLHHPRTWQKQRRVEPIVINTDAPEVVACS
jgi:hypothetical protein